MVLSFGSLAWAIDGAARTSAEDKRLHISAHSGAVELKVAGTARDVSVDATVDLPARIVTGADGSLGLRQQRTSISIAGDSDVEIPEAARDGQLIARLVQHRGNVFYDVETRPADKLHVDTPYLVAVVKGTQFNVAVDDERTMISLFEGQLEIRTPDGSSVIELNAGEIAIRSRVDATIRVLSMDAPMPQAQADTSRDGAVGLTTDAAGRLDGVLTGGGALGGLGEEPAARVIVDAAPRTALIDGGLSADVDLGKTGGGELGLATNLDLGGSANLGIDTSVDVGAGSVDVGLDTGLDLGGGSVDLGLDAGIDVAAGSVDVGLDAGVDLGAASVDVGLDTGIDLGGGTVDLGLDAGVDLGGSTVDLGLDTGIDVGGGTVDLGLDTGVDLGGSTVDLGLDTGIDVGGGAVDLGVDAGIDLGGTDLGVDATIDVGLDTGVDVDLGVDLPLVEPVVEPVVETLLEPLLDLTPNADEPGLLPGLPVRIL